MYPGMPDEVESEDATEEFVQDGCVKPREHDQDKPGDCSGPDPGQALEIAQLVPLSSRVCLHPIARLSLHQRCTIIPRYAPWKAMP